MRTYLKLNVHAACINWNMLASNRCGVHRMGGKGGWSVLCLCAPFEICARPKNKGCFRLVYITLMEPSADITLYTHDTLHYTHTHTHTHNERVHVDAEFLSRVRRFWGGMRCTKSFVHFAQNGPYIGAEGVHNSVYVWPSGCTFVYCAVQRSKFMLHIHT